MNRTSVQFYTVRQMNPGDLAARIAQTLGIPRESIVSISLDAPNHVPPHWFSRSGCSIGVQVRTVDGDFRSEVVVISNYGIDAEAMVRSLAHTLNVAILTDEFGVDGFAADEWMLVTPDGVASVVFTDDHKTDADHIVLDRASHKILDSRIAHAAD